MTFDFACNDSPAESRRNSALQVPSTSPTLADPLPVSTSAPTVNVIDFDSGQQKIDDVSTFTISAYLLSSSVPDEPPSPAASLEREWEVKATMSSLTAPRPNVDDDKTPTQSSFLRSQLKRKSSPEHVYDERTPTRSTFRKPQDTRRGSTLSSPLSSGQSLSSMEFATASPPGKETIDDDKTPTQSMFLKGQGRTQRKGPPSDDQRSQAPSEEAEPQSNASDDMDAGDDAEDAIPDLKHAKWLRDTIVELWIDQEGFRAIRPQFFLASVTNALFDPSEGSMLPLGETDPLFTTVAEFLPVSRAPHYFHHATLDRAPTLNRITVDGDEAKDYISRTATLALRDNGVFFVHGTEDHRLDGDNGPVVRLNWRFEYFVSSRRPDWRSTHRGEKTLTPLSFSCTPALLDRNRASKVKVLHIMRKTLLPKIVAQKLEPPDMPPRPSPAKESVADRNSIISFDSAPDVPSQADVRTSPSKVSLPSLKSGKNMLAKATARIRRGSGSEHPLPTFRAGAGEKHPTKQRRGSSVEGERRPIPSPKAGDGRRLSHKRPKSLDLSKVAGSNGRSTASIVGPIIPHEELLKLLAQDMHPEITSRRVSARIQTVNDEKVTVLPAPPRHK